jgi:hypothetical protein
MIVDYVRVTQDVDPWQILLFNSDVVRVKTI